MNQSDAPEQLASVFASLSREPDLTADNLYAHDATDRLILEVASPSLAQSGPGDVVTIGDRHGALTLGALTLGAQSVRVHQDPLLSERALAANAERLGLADAFTNHDLDEALLRDARLVLVQLPRSLDALREIADAIARWAHPDVRVLAGGRVKHMTLAMNDVFREFFAEVTPGLAKQKSRVLTVTGARRPDTDPPFPVWGRDPDLSFRLAAYGQTFGGASLDHGTRLLLSTLTRSDLVAGSKSAIGTDPVGGGSLRASGGQDVRQRVVDLGCGNGAIAAAVALTAPNVQIIATDQSRAAVKATELTIREAGVEDRVRVIRADGCEGIQDGWADLMLLNPPFHSGAIVHEGVAHRLIRSCARALRPGGELRVVHNSHLRYRPLIEQVIGQTRQVARDRTFTVVSALRRGRRENAG